MAESETQVVAKDAAETEMMCDGDFSVKCSKCQFPLDVEDVSSRKIGKQGPTCKSCHNVTTMLAKQLDHMPMEWDMMKPEEHVKFFQQCAEMKDASGTLKYKHVRATLVQTLLTREVSKFKRGAVGEFHPLQHWINLGHSKEDVEQKAEQMVHPTLGTITYRVDVFSVSVERMREEVEETLLSCSRDVKRKHVAAEPKPVPKKRAKGAEAPPPPVPLTEAQVQEKQFLQSMVIDSDSDCEMMASWFAFLVSLGTHPMWPKYMSQTKKFKLSKFIEHACPTACRPRGKNCK